MFVNRKQELEYLMSRYKMFLKGHSRGVLIYGFRKIGKTRLVEEFLRRIDAKGVIIDLSWASSIDMLANIFIERLERIYKIDSKIITEIKEISDPLEKLRKILMLPQRLASRYNEKTILALDEFHVLVEIIPMKLVKKFGGSKEKIAEDILWILRGVITSSDKVFWILITSIGWALIKEKIFERGKGALIGVLDKMKLDPLKLEDAEKLVLNINPKLDQSIAKEIARISGGIPRLIEIIAGDIRVEKMKLSTFILQLINEGSFDELFDSMIRFVSEFSKRDFDTLTQALKAVGEGAHTIDAVAKRMNITRSNAYILLEELTKLGLLEKKKFKKMVTYDLKYPLLAQWLMLRVEPRKSIKEILLRTLGITAESYIRELFSTAVGKKIEIWDDKKGSLFLGTTEHLQMKIKKVLSATETKKLYTKIGVDLDVICINDRIYAFEIKATSKPITEEMVIKVASARKKLEKTFGKNTVVGIIQLGSGEFTPKAISTAVKLNVILITQNAIKLIAKKLDFPHW